MPEDRGEIDTFKITFFTSSEGPGEGDYNEDEGIFFTGTYDDAVEHAKSFLKEEWRDKVELRGGGYTDLDSYGCDAAYFDPETGEEITEEKAEAMDWEVVTQVEGFNIYWDYPEKEEQTALSSQRKKALNIKSFDREDLENLFRSWIGEENIRKPLEEWTDEEIIYELEEYQRLLIESKTIFSSDLSIEKEKRRI